MKIHLILTLLMISLPTINIYSMEDVEFVIQKITENRDPVLHNISYVAILKPSTHAIVARKQKTLQGETMTACKFSLKSKKEKVDLDPTTTFNLLQII